MSATRPPRSAPVAPPSRCRRPARCRSGSASSSAQAQRSRKAIISAADTTVLPTPVSVPVTKRPRCTTTYAGKLSTAEDAEDAEARTISRKTRDRAAANRSIVSSSRPALTEMRRRAVPCGHARRTDRRARRSPPPAARRLRRARDRCRRARSGMMCERRQGNTKPCAVERVVHAAHAAGEPRTALGLRGHNVEAGRERGGDRTAAARSRR